MKPVARHPHLPPPEWQICKGTRMFCPVGGSWEDMKDGARPSGEIEALAETALREGAEEMGLKLANIRRLFDLGAHDFSSALTGKSKRMWLFAAELHAPDDFLPAHEVEAATAERGWLSASEFAVAGRSDHRYILAAIETRLRTYYADSKNQ